MSRELTSIERDAERAAQARDAGVDRGRRRSEGIVHTPAVLARFVARLGDALLREELGLQGGVADAALAIVDPACGPGAFLAAVHAVGGAQSAATVLGIDRDAAVLQLAREVLAPGPGEGARPLRLGHADTLSALPPQALSELAPAVLVIGNPPWIGSAQRRPAAWLDALLEDFRRDASGELLQERKLGVLADAYVRFLRWASELARLAPRGAVVALVTNSSYLDGPVHRGVRAALLRYFDALHVLDLGGNVLVSRGGARDGNVFGVRPGVAVLFAVRRPNPDEQRPAHLRYLRLAGQAAEKLASLADITLHDARWRSLPASAPHHRFVPTAPVRDEYARWPSLPELLPFHREGVQTNRDEVVVDRDPDRLLARLRAFAAGESLPELARARAPLAHYDPERARAVVSEALAAGRAGETVLRPILYRPFDTRWFLPWAPLCHRPRAELLAALDHSSLALVTARKDRGSAPWRHFLTAAHAVDNCVLSARSSCRARAFPTHLPDGRENLGPAALRWSEALGRTLRAEEIVYYVLAVLASPGYRAQNEEALHVDYPRIPPPEDGGAWARTAQAGKRLSALFTAPLPDGDGPAPLEGRHYTAPLEELRYYTAPLEELRYYTAPLEELRYDAATRELRAGSELLYAFDAPPPLVGHHDPLRALLREQAAAPLERGLVLELCRRLRKLDDVLAQL